MSLYLKYRPADLSQVVGNENIKATLQGMLDNLETCPHVFLLHGQSGCGKTTLGRIIANKLGCADDDFVEIDSADFRGIDTVREIRRNSQYKPISGPCRVWLIDECFAKGTLVKTPNGDVPIQNIKTGDTVFSLAGEDSVVNTFQNKIPLNRVAKITLSNGEIIICSKDHLFFTENGWQKACDLEKNTLVLPFVSEFMSNLGLQSYENNKTVPHLRKSNGLLSEQTRKIQQEILQPTVCWDMEYATPGNEGRSIQRKRTKKNIHWPVRLFNEYGSGQKTKGVIRRPNEKEQPFLSKKKYIESPTNETNQWDITCMDWRARRQWEINNTPSAVGSCFGVGNRSGRKNRTFSVRQIGVSAKLQSRHRLLRINDCNRSGWESSFLEERYQIRYKKDREVKSIRVESVAIYQRGNNDQSFTSVIGYKERNQGYVTLYDLQVDRHPSYFANGVAVHNCHKLTNDAQNALLKILEDTPPHVYFILCTTEPQKLLATVRSRCIQLQVSPLNDAAMHGLLKRVTRSEGERLDPDILKQIVTDSMGQPRTALNILQQVLTVSPDERMQVAQRTAEQQSQIIELCRTLIKGGAWSNVARILQGLRDKEAEDIRRAVLGYMQAVLLNKANDRAAAVIEAFFEPTYNIGFPGIVYACYSVTKR